MVTCWERAGLLVFLYVMFSFVDKTFPYGFLDQVWYLIPLPSYFYNSSTVQIPTTKPYIMLFHMTIFTQLQ